MSDIVERAKAAYARRWEQPGGVYPQVVPSAVVELGDWASEYLPELVDEVERLRAENEQLHELIRRGLAYGQHFRTAYAAAARAELRRMAGMNHD